MEEKWFVGYGSLIFQPDYKGQKLEDWCEQAIDGYILEGVDFLYPSVNRSGAPTLTFDGSNRKVKVKCWQAIGRENIKKAESFMRNREGILKKITVTLDSGEKIIGLCADLPPKLKGESPRKIAERAVESEIKERQKGADRGGVTYIRKCEKVGLETPLMNPLLRKIENICRERRLDLS